MCVCMDNMPKCIALHFIEYKTPPLSRWPEFGLLGRKSGARQGTHGTLPHTKIHLCTSQVVLLLDGS